MFASQATVISVIVHYERVGGMNGPCSCDRKGYSRGIYAGIPELLYLVTCVLSTILFVLWYEFPVCTPSQV